jgi:magnesium transporter
MLFHRRARTPGARPGTMRIAADASPPRIHAISYDLDGLDEREIEDVEILQSFPEVPGVVWVDVSGFGDESTLRRIGEIFGVHHLARADVVNVPQRPKVEDYDDRHLIVTQMAHLREPRSMEVEQLSLILGPGWVLTFQEQPGDVFEPIRQRIRVGVSPIRRMGPDYLASALLSAIVDAYFPVVEAMGEEIDRLEEEVIGRPTPSTLHQIHEVRRMLISLHRIQWRQRDALGSMLHGEPSPFTPEVRVYLRDVYDHSVQVLDVIETSRDLVVGLIDIYLSAISNRTNDVMKTLTIMAGIFIPLTFIAGVYGMNFEYMPELHWRWAYHAVWGVMVVITTGLIISFRTKGWIGSRGTRNSTDGK